MVEENTQLGNTNKEDNIDPQNKQGLGALDTDSLKATKLGEVSAFERDLLGDKGSDTKGAEETTKSETETNEETKNEEIHDDEKSQVDMFKMEIDDSILDYQEGDTIKGIVRSIEKSGVLVDIKYKSDGFIANSEFNFDSSVNPADVLKPGDEIDVYIEKLETKEGYTKLSKKKADYEIAWNDIAASMKTKSVIDIRVTSKVEGGIVVIYKGIKGFVPASHVTEAERENMDALVGQSIIGVVIHSDRKRRKVVFSNKLAKNKPNSEEIVKIIEGLEVGEVCSGKVSSIKDFGVFVDIGGLEGLVHISELSWARVNHPSEVVSVGDEIKAFILGVDRENQKISLGIKQLQPDPWTKVQETYKLGQVVDGVVSRIVNFGAFIQIERDLEGLVHISQISHKRIEDVSAVLTVGSPVKAVIIKLQPEQQKIGLSLRELERSEQNSKEDYSNLFSKHTEH